MNDIDNMLLDQNLINCISTVVPTSEIDVSNLKVSSFKSSSHMLNARHGPVQGFDGVSVVDSEGYVSRRMWPSREFFQGWVGHLISV